MSVCTSPVTRGFLLVCIIPLNNLMAQVLKIVSKYWLKFNSHSKPQNGLYVFTNHITILVHIKLNSSSYHLSSPDSLYNLSIIPTTLKINYYYYYRILYMRKLKLNFSDLKNISMWIDSQFVFELRYLWLQVLFIILQDLSLKSTEIIRSVSLELLSSLHPHYTYEQ